MTNKKEARPEQEQPDPTVARHMHFDFVRLLQERISNVSTAAYHAGRYATNVHSSTTLNLRLEAILDRHARELENFLHDEVYPAAKELTKREDKTHDHL